ncbi:unnamed protein product [Cylicostephanus goldi]|uniref:Major facilitator superfamily (MFS) profile domain-containing protein n=1 Tax=Cylicostephanus goldi TaxID=71465 RepID=A0A3P6QT11_CYLGO|nr:unnamed protein product [Cylicostephanus goldi]
MRANAARDPNEATRKKSIRAERDTQIGIPCTKSTDLDTRNHGSRSSSNTVDYLQLDADKILSAYGKFGRYQMVIHLILNSVHILYATNMMIMPFITEDPNPKRISVFRSTLLQFARSFRYNYSDVNHESLASEFNLVCDNYESVEHGASVFMLGGTIVAPIITQLSDVYGRRMTFLIPLYVAVVANIICAIAPTYTIFLVFRFVAGVAASVSTGFYNFIMLWSLRMKKVLVYMSYKMMRMHFVEKSLMSFDAQICKSSLSYTALKWFVKAALHYCYDVNFKDARHIKGSVRAKIQFLDSTLT